MLLRKRLKDACAALVRAVDTLDKAHEGLMHVDTCGDESLDNILLSAGNLIHLADRELTLASVRLTALLSKSS